MSSYWTRRYNWALQHPQHLLDTHLGGSGEFWTARLGEIYPDYSQGSFDSSNPFSLPGLAALPSPFLMKDMVKAADRICQAIIAKERIVIFGDYDVDGTTSCAMLRRFFRALNVEVDFYIPDRLKEGYGLNPKGVSKLAAEGQGAFDLIITVDNGISAHDGCKEALKRGIDVIITDHHEPPPLLPEAYAILNPKQPGCEFPFPLLAGVGVAFFLMMGVRSKLRDYWPHGQAQTLNLKQFLDDVAIGTIADMVPLVGFNHLLCRVGLSVLTERVRTGQRPGVARLLELAGAPIRDKNWHASAVDVGFKIGPRLNAAGRLGTALKAVTALETDDDSLGEESAQALHEENSARQSLEKTFVNEAIAEIESLPQLPRALVLYRDHWHPGVVGLVASRVVERFYRPTLIFGKVDDQLKGSGRSTQNFDLFSALNGVRHEFSSFGGHFHAVGLSLQEEKLEWLRDHLLKCAESEISAADLVPPLRVEAQTSISALTLDFAIRIASLEPFGQKNPRPKWLVRDVFVRQMKRIGKNVESGHARLLLADETGEIWAVAFQMASDLENILRQRDRIDVVLEAKVGVWTGRQQAEYHVIDFGYQIAGRPDESCC